MTIPPTEPNTAPAPSDARGNAWLGARTALALRRSARFNTIWGVSFGVLTVLALLVPILGGDPSAAARATNGRLAADTLRSAQRVRDASAAVERAESLLVAARAPLATVPELPPPERRSTPSIAAATSSLADLIARIDRARTERATGAWIALADHPAVSAGPRMRSLVDSLRAYATRSSTPDLQQRVARAGNTIVAIAQNRRAELEANGAGVVSAAAAPTPVRVSTPARTAAVVALPDTSALRAALAAARDTLARAQRSHDSLAAALLGAAPANEPRGGLSLVAAVPAIMMAALLILGLLARFGLALQSQISAPTLADASEAERIVRAPVLATVRDAMLDGPARFQPSGIDPFRILYLGLTATGTRVRTSIVTGADPVIVAATAARLAIASAADHRQTLIVDLDPVEIPLSRTFRERAEPGTTDALARAFTWREVARPVGSSDGLPITLLPAGTERQDFVSGTERQELMDSFTRLRATYELTIVAAPPGQMAVAGTLVDASPVILTATVGETALSDLEREVADLRAANHRIQGVVLWDAPRPELPSRAELAALLSKRKGRTPGGSFEAVQRATGSKSDSTRRPQ